MHKYEELPDSTRVWIYQAQEPFKERVIEDVKGHLRQFAENWISHNRQLKSYADILHNRFVILMVDESQAGASGCSIDTSVHFLKQLSQQYGVELFDRMTFTYQDEGEVRAADRATFAKLYAEGKISDQTLVYDTLVATKKDFDKALLKPLGESWHKRMV